MKTLLSVMHLVQKCGTEQDKLSMADLVGNCAGRLDYDFDTNMRTKYLEITRITHSLYLKDWIEVVEA